MKKQIHPKVAQTLIQMKDGSTYMKKWLFFRPVLSLEIDYLVHQLWRRQPNKENVDISSVSKKAS